MSKYVQKILFGSPGTGKSYKVEREILPSLGIEVKDKAQKENCIKTVFHPEYTYGDFIGKLLPITKDKNVEYNYYAGHFLRALAKAYRNILEDKENPQHVVLVIDEINRGNSSAIFGTIFQLLDREDDGWSSYDVDISQMEFEALFDLIGITFSHSQDSNEKGCTLKGDLATSMNRELFNQIALNKKFQFTTPELDLILDYMNISSSQIKIPSNLSIIATMNTSESSIYYMDSAFKRRWDWEFVGIEDDSISVDNDVFNSREDWKNFVTKLNSFIRKSNNYIRNIEDKQVGQWFIKDEIIKMSQIRNKLLFFLWDSVFSRDKKPLRDLIEYQELLTFGDFANKSDDFIQAILKKY